jgi:hypothetical protein
VSEIDRRQIARQQAVRRAVNNAIAAGRAEVEADRKPYLCECGLLGCNRLIEVSQRDYRDVRAHPRRFVVRAGHVVSGVDRVICRYRTDAVVVEVPSDLADALTAA